MYETARFFTVTGDHVNTTPSQVTEQPNALETVYNGYIAETESSRGENSARTQQASEREFTVDEEDSQGVTLEDEELLERAQNASNGEKFKRLWRGSTAGYESQSEADMALCCLLAFWTGGDQQQIDRLFRQSGLLRDKWDEVHYVDGSTYGEKTIERAIANTSELYHQDIRDESSEPTTRKGEPSTVDSRDESEPNHAYLAEKNRLLTDRVDELEATLKQKNDHIDHLEAEIKRLNTEPAERDREAEQTREEQAGTTSECDTNSGASSLWGRLFGDNSK